MSAIQRYPQGTEALKTMPMSVITKDITVQQMVGGLSPVPPKCQ